MYGIILSLTLALFASQAFAAEGLGPCGPAGDVFKQLLDKYKESPSFVGTSSSDVAITVTTSPAGTWTMIARHGDAACILAAGDNWASAPPVVTPNNAPLPGLQPNGLILIHSWFSGTTNKAGQSCCGGSDCDLLPDDAVRAVPGGYLITYLPPGFPNGNTVTTPIFVPNAEASPGKDPVHYATCIWDHQRKCFFTPVPSY